MSLQKSLISGKSQGSSLPVAVEFTISKKYAAKNPVDIIEITIPINGKLERKESIKYNMPPITIINLPEPFNGYCIKSFIIALCVLNKIFSLYSTTQIR